MGRRVKEMREVDENLEAYCTYIPGPRGVEGKIDESTGAISWYVYDGLGSKIAEVNSAGVITSANVKTDVYGSVIDSAGSGSDHNFCGGLGHASEDETGLIYMRARWYDPAIGRFISEDSAMDGVNWYSYCAGNPVNLIDESGKSPVGVALAIGGIAVGCFSSDIFLGVFLASFSAIMAIVGLPFAIAGAVWTGLHKTDT